MENHGLQMRKTGKGAPDSNGGSLWEKTRSRLDAGELICPGIRFLLKSKSKSRQYETRS